MRRRVVVSLVLSSVLCACGPDAPADAGACPITAPMRLAPAPEDFVPAEDAWYGLAVFDDDIFFTFDRFDDPDRVYWRLDRCTGAVEEYEALAPGLHNPVVVESPAGRVLYANDDARRPLIVDRMDQPGTETPRPIPGLPDDVSFFASIPYSQPTARFYQYKSSERHLYDAAGIGAWTFALYTHAGDPDVAAVQISDQLLEARALDDHHDLILEDSGEVHRVDLTSGERELVKAGVRHIIVSGEARAFIWQAIGDDIVEPVYLHDLDAGTDIQVAVNDFAAVSWNRDRDVRHAGGWSRTIDQSAAAMVGPDDRWVTAVLFATGEVVPAPEHVGRGNLHAGYFGVLLAAGGEDEEVEALWDPRTGAVRTWYRGPAGRQRLLAVDDTRADYLVDDGRGIGHQAFWRTDFATGESVRLLDDVGQVRPLGADLYLVPTVYEFLEIPPNAEPGYHVRELQDLALVDVASGRSTPIAGRVSGYDRLGDEGIVFLDTFGPEPGLWVWPLPQAEPRSAALGDDRPRPPASLRALSR